MCHVSVRTLQRHFHKHYDVTVSQWLHELRLEQARIQLTTAESIKEVAYTLGYKRPSHFTRDFKLRFGVPPKTWLLLERTSRVPLIFVPCSGQAAVEKDPRTIDLFNQN